MRKGRTALGRVARWIVRGAALLLLGSVLQVATLRVVLPPLTPTMVGQVVTHARETGELRWVDYRPRRFAADHPVARAAVASEDARFFLHGGFDWPAVCSALEERRKSGRLRGASTLSQQVARNVFLWQGRSWVRKGLETWYTIWLELLLPKERILEVYLNIAETGPMTFGFEAGAARWYEVEADALTPAQAGRLVGILPAPRRWSPQDPVAGRRAAFIGANPAPFPGDPGFATVQAAWRERGGQRSCLLQGW